MPVIIEVKVNTEECGGRVAEVVCAADAVDRVCLAGFGWRSARGARRAAGGRRERQPARGAAGAACSWVGWPLRGLAYDGYQVPEQSGGCGSCPAGLSVTPTGRLAVEVWTVDERPDMDRLLGWGVDGLISNRPDLAVAARDAYLQSRTGSPIQDRRIFAAQPGSVAS